MTAPAMRTFGSGATRNVDTEKLDYEGFLHPRVLQAFAEYMHGHRVQADGSLRSADNWQKGIPREVYMSSLWRHFMDVWALHRGVPAISPETGQPVDHVEAIMACLFNLMGYAFELLKERSEAPTAPLDVEPTQVLAAGAVYEDSPTVALPFFEIPA